VGALSNPEVANYLNQHFVCSFQKVGNFRIVNGQKQGGNVASYFTLPDGRVLHVVAGPVAAGTLLNEARWVVETRKLAVLKAQGDDAKYKASWRRAHAERLQAEYGIATNFGRKSPYASWDGFQIRPTLQSRSGLPAQAKVHRLLANAPLIGIEKIYREVFEHVLNQRISNLPVVGETGRTDLKSVPRGTGSVRFRQPIVAAVAVADLQETREATAEEKSANDERTASRQLKLALMLLVDAKKAKNDSIPSHDASDSDRLLDLASTHFREIVLAYPNTLAAQEARRLLEED
jgi:hypothetical protein